MADTTGVQAHLANEAGGVRVVFCVHGVGKQKLRHSLVGVQLDGGKRRPAFASAPLWLRQFLCFCTHNMNPYAATDLFKKL
jgi:hypothetical protein